MYDEVSFRSRSLPKTLAKPMKAPERRKTPAKSKKVLEGGKTVRREVLVRPLSPPEKPANQKVSQGCSICLESKGGGRHDKRVVHETHPKCRISECTS